LESSFAGESRHQNEEQNHEKQGSKIVGTIFFLILHTTKLKKIIAKFTEKEVKIDELIFVSYALLTLRSLVEQLE
jgi:hypothetical protein